MTALRLRPIRANCGIDAVAWIGHGVLLGAASLIAGAICAGMIWTMGSVRCAVDNPLDGGAVRYRMFDGCWRITPDGTGWARAVSQ